MRHSSSIARCRLAILREWFFHGGASITVGEVLLIAPNATLAILSSARSVSFASYKSVEGVFAAVTYNDCPATPAYGLSVLTVQSACDPPAGLSGGAIAGIAVGAAVGGILIVIVIVIVLVTRLIMGRGDVKANNAIRSAQMQEMRRA